MNMKNALISAKGVFGRFFSSLLSNPQAIAFLILFLVSTMGTACSVARGWAKDKMIERAKARLEAANRRFIKLEAVANEAVKAYDELKKKVQDELSKNAALSASIEEKKKKLSNDLKREGDKIKKLKIGGLVDEFNKLGYKSEKKHEPHARQKPEVRR